MARAGAAGDEDVVAGSAVAEVAGREREVIVPVLAEEPIDRAVVPGLVIADRVARKRVVPGPAAQDVRAVAAR